MTIAGPTASGTVYEVVIPQELGDVFGQSLGESATVEFSIDEASPHLSIMGGQFATVDPLGAQQTIPVLVLRWEQLRVRLYAVEPSENELFLDHMSRGSRSLARNVDDVPWPLAVDETVDTGIDDDALTEIPVDLSGALDGEHGHVVMVVNGAGNLAETEPGYSTTAWVQDTDIGLDMITDYRDVAVWTTDLRSGGPLPDAEVTWTVTTRQSSYSPPNWSEYTFGVWHPWWYLGDFDAPWVEPERKTFSGKTASTWSVTTAGR